jgi:hypothetical protein
MTTITQSISSLGSVPTTADPATFDSRADTFLGTALPTLRTEINTWAGQANAVATEVSASATSVVGHAAEALANSNFVGEWSLLSGAKTVPLCVSHEGSLWILLSNIADVTAKEPGVAAEWAAVEQSTLEARTSNTALLVSDKGKIIEFTGSSTYSQTFGPAADLGNGWDVWLLDSGTGVITLDPNSTEQIDSATTKRMPKDTILYVRCNGSSFRTISFAMPVATESRVWARQTTGYGSTNNKIRLMATRTATGSAITGASTAADGASFTINEPGLYQICYSDGRNGNSGSFGISKNSSQLTTAIPSITAADILAYAPTESGTQANSNSINITVRLAAGDVIRPHTDGTCDFTSGVFFNITRVAP